MEGEGGDKTGGGFVIIPLLKAKYVDEYQWLEEKSEDFAGFVGGDGASDGEEDFFSAHCGSSRSGVGEGCCIVDCRGQRRHLCIRCRF